MKTNESSTDRIVRVGLAAAAAVGAVAVGATTAVGVVLIVVAGIMVLTAATGFCPLYRLFGISTCRVPASR